MANVIITNDGQAKITNAILNNTSVFPKYFKVSSTDYALDPTLTDIDGWITKDINSWLVVDNNTVMITCVVEAYEATNECVTVGIYDIDNTLLFIGKPTTPYPAGTRQIITFDILLTNISQVLDFSYLPWNDSEVYLLLNQISTQNANEFTEVYQKITDLSVKVDQLRNDIDNLIVGGTVSNSVTLDGYPASQAADPNTVAVRDSSGALTIAPAGSADQAVTLQQADDRYVNVTGDTMTGSLNVIGSNSYVVVNDGNGTTYKIGPEEVFSEPVGLSLRVITNPNIGEPIFVVQSAGGAKRLIVEHAGAVKTQNAEMYVNVNTDGTGGYKVLHEGDYPDLDARYVNSTGDTINGTLTVNGSFYVNTTTGNIAFSATSFQFNQSPVITLSNFQGPDVYEDVGFAAVSTYTFTIPRTGLWLIISTGVVTCGNNGSYSRMYVNGTLTSELYMGDWPDGNAPVTHTAVGFWWGGQTISITLDCANTRTIRAIRITPFQVF